MSVTKKLEYIYLTSIYYDAGVVIVGVSKWVWFRVGLLAARPYQLIHKSPPHYHSPHGRGMPNQTGRNPTPNLFILTFLFYSKISNFTLVKKKGMK